MNVLVTGARGFLGRRVVEALLRRGHRVRALDRQAGPPPGTPALEGLAADLRTADLRGACEGVACVVHLAAELQGDGAAMVATAVVGTERLLDAMASAGVGRMVLASSLSVYDWSVPAGVLEEESPLEPHPETRGPYALGKLRQEEVARDRCGRAGVILTVLRPAILWGPGREVPATIGQVLGPVHVVFDAARPLPAVHVENCADAFAAMVERDRGGTFDVVDHPEVSAATFVRDHLRRSGRRGLVVPAAYGPSLAAIRLLRRVTPAPLRARAPSFLDPARFEGRYRPVRVEGRRLREAGWAPPLSYAECLARTYPPRPGR